MTSQAACHSSREREDTWGSAQWLSQALLFTVARAPYTEPQGKRGCLLLEPMAAHHSSLDKAGVRSQVRGADVMTRVQALWLWVAGEMLCSRLSPPLPSQGQCARWVEGRTGRWQWRPKRSQAPGALSLYTNKLCHLLLPHSWNPATHLFCK